MTTTYTTTETYTRVNVAKVFEFFRAELRLVARSTATWQDDQAAETADDIVAHAFEGYLDTVHVVLRGADGGVLCVAQYAVSGDIGGRVGQRRPGGNLWPLVVGSKLETILVMSATWRQLSPEARRRFHAGLKRSWGPSDRNLTYPGMTASEPRDYVSNSYGLRRTTLSRG